MMLDALLEIFKFEINSFVGQRFSYIHMIFKSRKIGDIDILNKDFYSCSISIA